MTAQQAFSFGNLWIMPFWFLMIFAPRWRFTERFIGGSLGMIAFLVPAVLYGILIIPQLSGLGPMLANPQLNQLAAALGTPEGMAVGWLHFLAFDLFIGRWIYLDARQRNVSAWWVSPTLFLTLMVGPVGLIAYLVVRAFCGKQDESTAPLAV